MKQVKISKGNQIKMNKILSYLSEGDGAYRRLKGGIVDYREMYTHDLTSLMKGEKLDAILVISRDNHLLAEKFPQVPIYFITSLNNKEAIENSDVRGVMRVEATRFEELIPRAEDLLNGTLADARKIAVYCDFPRLASQLLMSRHRFYFAEHKLPLDNKRSWDYALSAMVSSVAYSRLKIGRSLEDALPKRPLLNDEPMKALIRKFYSLLDVKGLQLMGFDTDFIKSVVEAN